MSRTAYRLTALALILALLAITLPRVAPVQAKTASKEYAGAFVEIQSDEDRIAEGTTARFTSTYRVRSSRTDNEYGALGVTVSAPDVSNVSPSPGSQRADDGPGSTYLCWGYDLAPGASVTVSFDVKAPPRGFKNRSDLQIRAEGKAVVRSQAQCPGGIPIFLLDASAYGEWPIDPKPTITTATPAPRTTTTATPKPAPQQAESELRATFRKVFGRTPTTTELAYWNRRFREKKSLVYIFGAMQYHKARGSTGPESSGGSVSLAQVNSLFRSVYKRNPSASEGRYWAQRLVQKPDRASMIGAMQYHKARGIRH